MSNMTFNDLLEKNGLIRGPFGSDMKKSLFVDKASNTVKVFTQENVFNECNDIGTYYISNDYYNQMKRFEIREGDFLVTCDGTLGKIMHVKNLKEKSVISSSLLILRLNNDIVDSTYFYYFWKYYFADVLLNRNVNSCLKHFPSLNVVREEKVILPSKDKQIKIGTFLKQFDDKIGINKQLINILFKKIKSLYSFEVTRKDIKVEYSTIANLCDIKTGKRDANHAKTNGKYKFFTCAEEDALCDTFAFHGPSILIAGNGALNVKVYNGKFDAYQRTYVLQPKNKKDFGVCYLAALYKLESLRSQSNGSIVKFIKLDMVNSISVPLVKDDTLLNQINDIIDEMLLLKKQNYELQKQIEFYTKSLLGNLISL